METLHEMMARHAREISGLVERMTDQEYKRGRMGSLPAVASNQLDEINERVAAMYALNPDHLRSKVRGSVISSARFHAYALGRAAGHTLAAIGDFYGQHHTSVIYGLARHEEVTGREKAHD